MEELQQKLINGEKLTEAELEEIAYTWSPFQIIEGEDGRWRKEISLIFEIEGRFFRLEYGKGLTEYQDDIFNKQPYEVYYTEKTETIVVRTWHKK